MFQPVILPQISGNVRIKSCHQYWYISDIVSNFCTSGVFCHFIMTNSLYHQSSCANPPIRKLAECSSVEKSKSSGTQLPPPNAFPRNVQFIRKNVKKIPTPVYPNCNIFFRECTVFVCWLLVIEYCPWLLRPDYQMTYNKTFHFIQSLHAK